MLIHLTAITNSLILLKSFHDVPLFLQVLLNLDALVEDLAVHVLANDVEKVVAHAALALLPVQCVLLLKLLLPLSL